MTPLNGGPLDGAEIDCNVQQYIFKGELPMGWWHAYNLQDGIYWYVGYIIL